MTNKVENYEQKKIEIFTDSQKILFITDNLENIIMDVCNGTFKEKADIPVIP